MTMNAASESFHGFHDQEEFFLKEMQKMAAEDMYSSLERNLKEKKTSDTKGNFEDITRPLDLNEDEIFYKNYFKAGKDPLTLKKFLQSVDLDDAVSRHLIIPELLPEIISYEMYDSEYFKEGVNRNVILTRHNRYTPPFLHRHDFYEIIYVYHGRCVQNIGLDRKQFLEGDLIFIAPGIYHTMEVFDDESIVLNILLRKGTFYQMFRPLMGGHNLISEFFSGGMYHSEKIRYLVFHKAQKNLAETRHRINYLWQEQIHNDMFSDQILVGMLIFLISMIMRNDQDVMESSLSETHSDRREDFQVLRYIEDHLSEVTLNDIADHFGFSVSHCSRLIKASTGQSFNDWKRALRIRRAEQLLLGTKTPVSEISAELGFENPESFIRAFKKELHITPAKYRVLLFLSPCFRIEEVLVSTLTFAGTEKHLHTCHPYLYNDKCMDGMRHFAV